MKGVTAKIFRGLHLRQVVTIMVLLFIAAGPFTYLRAGAATMTVRSVKLSNSDAGATATYGFTFDIITQHLLGSIQMQFCSNDPFPGLPCTPPVGMDASTATLTSQTGAVGFTISPNSTANNLLITRPASVSVPITSSYEFSGITNPSAAGSYYVRLQTFASTDGSGAAIDSGGLAFVIGAGKVSLSVKVPPYLLFCSGVVINDNFCTSTTGDYINFGNLSAVTAKSAQSQLLVATNGQFGYGITMSGTTMTSGTNVITAMSVDDVSRPGLNQFGVNLRANSSPAIGSDPVGPGTGQPTPNYNIPDRFRFNSGDIIASNANPEDTRKYTVSYIVNISGGQPVGVYVTTLSYICLANF